MATIVCGIDDSPGAVEALRVARTLSTDLKLRLVLAHVAAGWTAGAEHDLHAERRVEVGEAAQALARIAAEEAATLIVVGSRSQGRLRPGLRSGLAGELAASAPCPVVIVPPPPRR